MLKKDQNPGSGGAGEGELLNELSVEVTEEELKHEGEGSDPLDAIEDETVRSEAKKARAITRRIAKNKAKPPVKQEEEEEDEEDDEEDDKLPEGVASTKDLQRLATNSAKKLVPQEVRDLWDELASVPLGGFDPLDEASIAKNYIKRYNAYLVDNPLDPDDPSAGFISTSVMPGAGGKKVAKKEEEKALPNFKEPTDPKDWY